MINGIININKEAGFTSHDVVAKLRGILQFRHIGHTGTLDPAATGVLPVCIGSATKLCDMIQDKTKVYIATVSFGTATDTDDATGQVIKEMPLCVDEEILTETFKRFTGDILQIPPMYSAIKVNGQKLYDLARQGKTLDLKPRPVHIDSIELLETVPSGLWIKEAKIRVTCGKGTYIRSLCRDLGEINGSCAHMKDLVRVKTGQFEIDSAYTLAEVEEARNNGTLDKIILPISEYFDYDKLNTLPEFDKLIHNGNPLRQNEVAIKPVNEFYRMYDSTGQFCGVYRFYKDKKKLYPEKMFLEM